MLSPTVSLTPRDSIVIYRGVS